MDDWFENESFWVQYAPIMFDTSRWKEAPAVAEGIFKLAGTGRQPQELKIFDAGCGLGRIAVELAILGAWVTGRGPSILRSICIRALATAKRLKKMPLLSAILRNP